MLQAFYHHDRRTFADHQSLPISGERPASVGRSHTHSLPPFHWTKSDTSLRSAGHCARRASRTYQMEREPYGVICRRACACNGKTGPPQTTIHGHLAGRRAHHHLRNSEGMEPFCPFSIKALVAVILRRLPPATSANNGRGSFGKTPIE